MAEVTSKQRIIADAAASANEADQWHDFREIEILNLELTQHYQHSLGKYSKFFIELENKRFLATRCPGCQRVFAPPRPICPDCSAVTHWQELTGTGTVMTYSVMHFSSGANDDIIRLPSPFILAYVLLDGASTLFPHILKAATATVGMRVRVAYSDGPVAHPIHLMHFVPQED